MIHPAMYDVVIAGAGVSGSYVAYRLASSGHRVAVFEEHGEVGKPVHCTGIIGAECFQRFPLFHHTVLRTANSATLFSPSGRELTVRRDETQAYIIDRRAFDRSLAERSQILGAEYFLRARIADIAVLDDAVRVETEDGRSFTGKAAVIASGCRSSLLQRLGTGRPQDIITGAQAEVFNQNADNIEVYFDQKVATGFFGWLVPTTEDRALVGLFSRRETAKHMKDFVEMLVHKGKIAAPQLAPVYAGIPLKPPGATYMERVLVVGDAAGQVKPTTGGGIYFGLLCAELAADMLHQALSTGDFSENRFSSYQQAWRRVLGRELRIDRFARRLYQRLSNRHIDFLFDLARSNGIHEYLARSPELSFDWHGDAIIKGLGYLGPWRRLFTSGGGN